MERKKKFSVQDVDFSKTKNWSDVMDVFITVAKKCPTHAEELFNKFVVFQCRKNPRMTKEKIIENAVANIGYMAGYYDTSTRKKLYSVYNNISHPIFGREY